MKRRILGALLIAVLTWAAWIPEALVLTGVDRESQGAAIARAGLPSLAPASVHLAAAQVSLDRSTH